MKATHLLPSSPGVALSLLRLVQDGQASAAQISRVLRSDPALTGRLLKYANDTLTFGTRPLVSVPEAVLRLGVQAVRGIALSFSLLSNNGSNPCHEFDYAGYWSSSLATAIAARELAERTNCLAPDEAFTCGLLCQVGRLGLASVHPDAYAALLAQCRGAPNQVLIERERKTFATDHNELTGAMMCHWGLPQPLALAAKLQEFLSTEGASVRANEVAPLLHVAGRLGRLCNRERQGESPPLEELSSAAQLVGLALGELRELHTELSRKFRSWHSEVLQLRAKPDDGQLFYGDSAPVGEEAQSSYEAATSPSDHPLRVLIVDDDRAERKLVSRHLAAAGHLVVTAGDGNEGLQLALEFNPQLVITDWMMPEMNGLAFCRALRQTKLGRQLYVMILTGCEEEDRLIEAFEAGADDYLLKPFRPKTLTARIRACQRVIHLQEEVLRDKEELRRTTAELAVANRKLQEAALTDVLTALPNRRYAMERLARDWADAAREKTPLSCLVIDIDHFKQVNDDHGHDTGDIVLHQIALLLRQCTREADVACRLGGEEFLIICTGTEKEGAAMLAERARAAVEGRPIHALGRDHRLTISVGVASKSWNMKRPQELLKAADQAVYRAKQLGRNCVVVAPEPQAAEDAGNRPSADCRPMLIPAAS